jgi:hypothetical protein
VVGNLNGVSNIKTSDRLNVQNELQLLVYCLVIPFNLFYQKGAQGFKPDQSQQNYRIGKHP